MITGFGGDLVLSWTSLYYGIVWIVVGMICTLITERRGLYVAIILAAVVPGFFAPGWFFIVNAQDPMFQFFRFAQLSDWVNYLLIPLFGAVIGGLLGELISPSVED